MSRPFGKASRHTFERISTLIPCPNWNSSKVQSFNSHKFPNKPPSEALKKGLLLSVSATGWLTLELFTSGDNAFRERLRIFTRSTMEMTVPMIEPLQQEEQTNLLETFSSRTAILAKISRTYLLKQTPG
jgi:hypothetical protein